MVKRSLKFWKCASCLRWNHEEVCFKCGKAVQMALPTVWHLGKAGDVESLRGV